MTKSKQQQTAISPTRAQDYPEWYQQVIKASELAEISPVRGCMIIKPHGFALWENMQRALDDMIKETGHVNAYFPLLIPLEYLQQEAEHIDGFAKECAVVTHHRLEKGADGKLVPAGELEQPLVIRPTSEMIIGHAYAKWVQSYRDLPILINQWANVMRWEMRTRMFLRTSEFLWQEGHTVHATDDEAMVETKKMLEVYAEFAEKWLAIPVVKGEKTPDERFPGAVNTYSIEALMQDGKALQAGTSHFLGQKFSRSCGIKFLNREGEEMFAWTTSWGVSTRLVGALIMSHSDDNGLVLPPKVAPQHVVILPIYRKDEDRERVLEFCQTLATNLRQQNFDKQRLRVAIDDRDLRGGEKTWQHIKKGTPIRIEVGPRDIEKQAVMVARRDRDAKDKQSTPVEVVKSGVVAILEEMQEGLFKRALAFRESRTKTIESLADFESYFGSDDCGFALAPWCEEAIDHPVLSKLKVTPRCIPENHELRNLPCLFTGKPATDMVLFAKAY